MSPLISVIVPVYNTEMYIHRCISSILSQSYSNFELVIVIDGSTDNSGKICDEYAESDCRIRVFHKESGGVSSARNLGLDNAKGEWVCFVDSDDELMPNGIQTMVDCISNDVDSVIAGYERYNESGSVVYRIEKRTVVTLDKKSSLSILYENHSIHYRYLGYAWGRLFRNKIIQKHNLRFDTELRIKEDTLFVTQYLSRSRGITRFNTMPVYRYYYRRESAMGGLKRGFDYRYIDTLYAFIKMRDEIHRVFNPFSEVAFIADEGIWIRYNKILNLMSSLAIQDDELKSQMHHDVYKALKLQFFVRKKIRNLRRKWFHSN